jgi:NAD(P)-dependent dehydrogenase (short-subunit alcohol dehydrogenase family)
VECDALHGFLGCYRSYLVSDRFTKGVRMSLSSKHALITGSSRGIGRGIALKLAERGVNVAIHYYQNETAAKETLAKVQAAGADGFIVQADVTHPDQIRRMFGEVASRFGALDIFVSNARPEAPEFFHPPLATVQAALDPAVFAATFSAGEQLALEQAFATILAPSQD